MSSPESSTDALERHIEALDIHQFAHVRIQATADDKRALLALEVAARAAVPSFSYLEIGSYHGGSIQVLIRDPRCSSVMSIDARTAETPDEGRGVYRYRENTTAVMRDLLSCVPEAHLEKLSTFDTTTQAMSPTALPDRPTLCFIDGEHSHNAVLRDAQFCDEAMAGAGVIAFHDYRMVQSAINAFLRARRRDISVAFPLSGPTIHGHGVFALELQDGGILQHPAIHRAIGSRPRRALWRAANRPRRPAWPVLGTLAVIPAVDAVADRVRPLVRR